MVTASGLRTHPPGSGDRLISRLPCLAVTGAGQLATPESASAVTVTVTLALFCPPAFGDGFAVAAI